MKTCCAEKITAQVKAHLLRRMEKIQWQKKVSGTEYLSFIKIVIFTSHHIEICLCDEERGYMENVLDKQCSGMLVILQSKAETFQIIFFLPYNID